MNVPELRKANEADVAKLIYPQYPTNQLKREAIALRLLEECVPYVIKVRDAFGRIGLDVSKEEALLNQLTGE